MAPHTVASETTRRRKYSKSYMYTGRIEVFTATEVEPVAGSLSQLTSNSHQAAGSPSPNGVAVGHAWNVRYVRYKTILSHILEAARRRGRKQHSSG